MARTFPQGLVVHERRLHLDIARWEQHLTHVVRQEVVQRRAFVEPECGAGSPLVKREQPKLAPQLAVVALLGFFNLREIRLQILVGEECRAVDALHRLVARIAFPVGVRCGQQLERLQPAACRHVRPDAEIDKEIAIPDRVDRYLFLAFCLLLNQLHLQRFASIPEEADRLVARPHLTLVNVIARGDFLHPLFDGRKIFGHERPLDDKVVEETFVGWGTDPALHVREELRHGGGKEVGGAVTVHRQRLGIFRRDHPNLRVFLERIREIDKAVVHHARVRCLREARRYRRGDVADSRSARDRLCRPVGEGDGELGQGVVNLESTI